MSQETTAEATRAPVRVRSVSRLARTVATFATVLTIITACQQTETATANGQENWRPLSQPLPASGFRVEWLSAEVPADLQAGQKVEAKVTLKNASDAGWPNEGPTPESKENAVSLGYRWRDAQGPIHRYDANGRYWLPKPLLAGEQTTVPVTIAAPSKPGRYEIEFGMVQENVAWFEERNGTTLRIPVQIR